MTLSRRAQENILATFLLLVFIGVAYLSLGYSPRARLVPLPIAVLGIVLTSIQLFWQNARSADDLQINVLDMVSRHDENASRLAAEAKRAEGSGEAVDAQRQGFFKSEMGAFLVLAALIAMFLVLGPLPAVFLFSLGFFVLSRHCGFARGLVYAVLCTGVLFVLFDMVLRVEMNRGLAAPYINQIVSF